MYRNMNSSYHISNESPKDGESESRIRGPNKSHTSLADDELQKFPSKTIQYSSPKRFNDTDASSWSSNERSKQEREHESYKVSPTKLIVNTLSAAFRPKPSSNPVKEGLRTSSISLPEVIQSDVNIKLLQKKATSIEDFADTSSEGEDRTKPKDDDETISSIIEEYEENRETEKKSIEFIFKEEFDEDTEDKSAPRNSDSFDAINTTNSTSRHKGSLIRNYSNVSEEEISTMSSSIKSFNSRTHYVSSKRKTLHRKTGIVSPSSNADGARAPIIYGSPESFSTNDQISDINNRLTNRTLSGTSEITVNREERLSGGSLPHMDNILASIHTSPQNKIAQNSHMPTPSDNLDNASSPVNDDDSKKIPKSILSFSSGELLHKLQLSNEQLVFKDNETAGEVSRATIAQSALERANLDTGSSDKYPRHVFSIPPVASSMNVSRETGAHGVHGSNSDSSYPNIFSPTRYPLDFQNYVDDFRHDKPRAISFKEGPVLSPPPRITSFSDKLSRQSSHEFMLSDEDYLYRDDLSDPFSHNGKLDEEKFGFQQQKEAGSFHSWFSFIVMMLTSLIVPPVYFMISIGIFDTSYTHRSIYTGIYSISQPMMPLVNRRKRFSKTQKIISFAIGLLWLLGIVAIIAAFMVYSVHNHQ